MKIMQIMSNSRHKTVVFKPDAGSAQVRCFPVSITREAIAAALEKVEQKKPCKKRKSEED